MYEFLLISLFLFNYNLFDLFDLAHMSWIMAAGLIVNAAMGVSFIF